LVGAAARWSYQLGRAGFAALQATRVIVSERSMLASANLPFKTTALSVAGRALTKHPNVVGAESGEALSRLYRTPQALNEAAYGAVSRIMSDGVRVARPHNRIGSIVEYTLDSGIGIRFNAEALDFITFLGR